MSLVAAVMVERALAGLSGIDMTGVHLLYAWTRLTITLMVSRPFQMRLTEIRFGTGLAQ